MSYYPSKKVIVVNGMEHHSYLEAQDAINSEIEDEHKYGYELDNIVAVNADTILLIFKNVTADELPF